MPELVLYSYFRSSAAYRVRIALNLKDLDYETRYVDLRKGEQQNKEDYLHINPQGLIPTLVHENKTISQSLAIIEYLDEIFPEPALLPKDIQSRAWVRAFAQSIACDIHPLNNLRVLQYLNSELNTNEEARNNWYHHWIDRGFESLETLLQQNGETLFCHGDTPTLADILLIPQVYNALRYYCDLSPYTNICRIYETCLKQTAFHLARPENQPDAVS